MHVNDVYIGNGVSELIVMAMQGLLDDGDEMLIPMRTIRYGQLPLTCRAVQPFTISVMKKTVGILILPILKVKLLQTHVVLSLSIRTTQLVRYIHVMCLSKLWHLQRNMT